MTTSTPTPRAVVRLLFHYRGHVKAITADNGCDFAAHPEITKGLSMKGHDKIAAYFAGSYSSWRKGAIENANRLIRKYIPEKANLEDFCGRRIINIQKKLNRRPREIKL